MRTLAWWENRLLQIPDRIECHEMSLSPWITDEPPLFIGPGYIEILSDTSMCFTMFAQPIEVDRAFQCLKKAQLDPYDERNYLRLLGTDYQGVQWNCGMTIPRLKGAPSAGWPLTGEVSGISTVARGPMVSQERGVELIFSPAPTLPMCKVMESVTSVGGDIVFKNRQPGQQIVETLGSEICFNYDPKNGSLRVTASSSDSFHAPYAENWIAEPLRIMLGRLIYPRLVARNMGDGTSIIWVRPAPRSIKTAAVGALMDTDHYRTAEEFWDLYTQILNLIATSIDTKGNPYFESHPLTRFFEEITQASTGSRWVLCLTLASTSEGLAKMIMKPSDQRADVNSTDIDGLSCLVGGWGGDLELKKRILSEIKRAGQRSVGGYFQLLVSRGILTQENKKAWSIIRNSVMHGHLITPWSSEEEDRQLHALVDLVHRLAKALISSSGSESKAQP